MKLEAVTDDGSRASLNVMEIAADEATPVAPGDGVDATTVGGVTSGATIVAACDAADCAETIPFEPFADMV
jgi:hypothetical protein